MSARQNLKLKSLAMGIKDKEHMNELMDIAGLTNVGKKPVKKYSLGMKQRLGIALALIGFPNLVILDEPLNGLDPQGIVEFRKIIARLNSERKINFIISSHILGELSKIATDYVIIHNGVLIEQISKILYAVAVTIATKIFYGNQFAIGSFSSLILLLGVQYFLHLGFACVIVFICVLTKSSAFTMASGILISFNIMSIVYSLVNKLIPFISSNADIDITIYLLTTWKHWRMALSELLQSDLYSLSSLRFVLVLLLKKEMCYKICILGGIKSDTKYEQWVS